MGLQELNVATPNKDCLTIFTPSSPKRKTAKAMTDLLGVRKGSEAFYPRILREIGAGPKDVLVVDDEDDALDAAKRAGARTAKVGRDSNGSYDFVVENLSELPPLIL